MLRPGDEPIPGYRLESFLGKGQFGQVWKTTAPGGGSAAIKFLDLTGKEGRKELRGIQQVKTIRHPNLMPITALWLLNEDGEILSDDFFADLETTKALDQTIAPADIMEPKDKPRWLVVAQLLGEQTLGDRLKQCLEEGKSGIPVRELLTHMEDAAKGIDYLNAESHDLGDGLFAVQHCDIKPDNMLLVGGSVMVCDFGLAHIMFRSNDAARTTGMPGSPAYIAPECIGRQPSGTSDQYSLAVSYYELRTGELPFVEQTPVAALDAHRQGSLQFDQLDAEELTVLTKATALQPADRYESCVDFVAAMKAVHGGGASTAPPKRSLLPWVMALCVLLLAFISGLVFMMSSAGKSDHEFRISVTPTDATITIDGEAAKLAEGILDLSLPPGSTLSLVISKGADYAVHSQQVRADDYSHENPLAIALDRSASFKAKEALASFQSGQLDTAIGKLGEAIQQDARFASFPKPRLVCDSTVHGPIESFEVSPDGAWLIAGFRDGSVGSWRTSELTDEKPQSPKIRYQHGGLVEGVDIIGDTFVTCDDQQTVSVANLQENGKSPASFKLDTFGEIALEVCNDGNTVFTGSANQLTRWDREGSSFKPLALGQHQDKIVRIFWLPESSTVVTGSWDGTIQTWQQARQPREAGRLMDGEIFALAIHNSSIAYGGDTSGDEDRLGIVDDGGITHKLPDSPRSPVSTLQFGPQGEILAAGCEDDGTVLAWRNSSTGWRRIPLPVHHEATVDALEFYDNQYLVSGGSDGRIVLWDLASQVHHAATLGSGFSSSKAVQLRWVTSHKKLFALIDGKLWSWDLAQCVLLKQACDKIDQTPKDPFETPKEPGVEA